MASTVSLVVGTPPFSNCKIRPDAVGYHIRGAKKVCVFASGSSRVESKAGRAHQIRDDLMSLVVGEDRGVRTQRNSAKREQIIRAVDALAELASDGVTTDESLTAAWRMLWTTEKETLFILERASFFGTQAGDVLQIIDVGENKLQNVITFPPTGFFLVKSTIDVVSRQRVNFRFVSATLKVGGLRIPIPPYGQGWFETVYMDDKIRVAKDIRNDYLICDRASVIPEGLGGNV